MSRLCCRIRPLSARLRRVRLSVPAISCSSQSPFDLPDCPDTFAHGARRRVHRPACPDRPTESPSCAGCHDLPAGDPGGTARSARAADRVLDPDGVNPRIPDSGTAADAGYQASGRPVTVQLPAATSCPLRLMTSSSQAVPGRIPVTCTLSRRPHRDAAYRTVALARVCWLAARDVPVHAGAEQAGCAACHPAMTPAPATSQLPQQRRPWSAAGVRAAGPSGPAWTAGPGQTADSRAARCPRRRARWLPPPRPGAAALAARPARRARRGSRRTPADAGRRHPGRRARSPRARRPPAPRATRRIAGTCSRPLSGPRLSSSHTCQYGQPGPRVHQAPPDRLALRREGAAAAGPC